MREWAPTLLSSNGGLLRPLVPLLRSLEAGGDPWALLVSGFARHDADFADAGAPALVERSLELFRSSGDPRGEGFALYTLGNQKIGSGEVAAATSLWEAGRALLGPESSAYAHALVNSSLGAYAAGDLRTALALAEQGLASSVAGGAFRAAGAAGVYIGAFSLWTGDFARVTSAIDLARASFAQVVDPAERYEWPIGPAVCGVLASLRGDRGRAEACFTEALVAADLVDAPWVRAMVLVLRAEHMSAWAAQRSLADARRAREILDAQQDQWWLGESRVATGVALAGSGNDSAAAHVLDAVLADGVLIPLQQARCTLLLGEARLRLGAPAVAWPLVLSARDALLAAGADYWAARACAVAAQLDSSARVRHWERAHGLAHPDPAFERLFLGSVAFTVRMLGPPRVVVGDVEVSFPSRHARLAVLALAAAGPSGLAAETLHTWLWPEAARDVGARRLKTALWQVRRALGPAAGRLRRTGARVTLLMRPGECDLADAVAAAEALLASSSPSRVAVLDAAHRLADRIAGGEEHDEWIADLQHRVDALRFRLAALG